MNPPGDPSPTQNSPLWYTMHVTAEGGTGLSAGVRCVRADWVLSRRATCTPPPPPAQRGGFKKCVCPGQATHNTPVESQLPGPGSPSLAHPCRCACSFLRVAPSILLHPTHLLLPPHHTTCACLWHPHRFPLKGRMWGPLPCECEGADATGLPSDVGTEPRGRRRGGNQGRRRQTETKEATNGKTTQTNESSRADANKGGREARRTGKQNAGHTDDD